jgi:hypothetical protein
MESKKLKKWEKQIHRLEGENRTRYQARRFKGNFSVLIDSKLVCIFPSSLGAGDWRPGGPPGFFV